MSISNSAFAGTIEACVISVHLIATGYKLEVKPLRVSFWLGFGLVYEANYRIYETLGRKMGDSGKTANSCLATEIGILIFRFF